MSTIEETIVTLERRVRELEDRLAIMQVIATYGPAVDSGSPGAAAGLWTEDGIYDTGPAVLTGRAEIEAMVVGPLHQSLIGGGAAHLQGMPHIAIEGDRAVATAYSQVVLREAATDGYRVWRTGVNRWELRRSDGGWRVVHRVNRQLDGTDEARDLLRAVVEPG